MATYKQRTPYQRHTATYSDEEHQESQASGTFKQPSGHASTLTSQHLYSSSHYQSADDDLLESSSNREWTSIRNSSASARAKARQQQYLDQQEQRTREWQFVLAQHRHSGHTTSRELSSDEYDDALSATEELPSIVTTPGAVDSSTGIVGAGNGEHSSFFGLSDLASDGLESVDESEDLGVWSHDEEDTLSLSTSMFRRHPPSSSPLAPSSLAASLSHIPRPSFASPLHGGSESRFQNQMPFHDGSGNFFTTRSIRSNHESDIESERGWDSSSSRASSVLRSYRSNARPATFQRRLSVSDFKAVIQNIADLQHTGSNGNALRHPSRRHYSSSQSRGVDSSSVQSLEPQPRFTYPNVVTPRPIFNIYESEMEDMADMVTEVPVKVGWLHTFEHVLRALQPDEYNIRVSDPTVINPIKALTHHLRPEDCGFPETRESSSSSDHVATEADTHPVSSAETAHSTISSSMALQEVKQNMASASLETMQRLQTRKRSTTPLRRYPSDPMQVEFTPTIRNHTALDETHRKERRTTSRSTGTSTSNNSKGLESNLLAVVLSTLRRFRDHVQSNLVHVDFSDEEDRHGDLSRSLGFDGDLGIQWSRTVDNADVAAHGASTTTTGYRGRDRERDHNRDRDRDRQSFRRHERTPSYASSVSRSSSQQNVRRVNSDCGLESMKHYKDHRHHIHPSHHRPSLVE
ncbi:hypothetical protein B0O80DRAFT_499979 [Mortierella sp. GBAus27b]|nr:hypothetical protein BGX31_000797 [Mortierella sp. GBA43]KAI8351588.1 hypothetical protein B0O80DRAFT_499979 [Mortierella sp. GBAus27b]